MTRSIRKVAYATVAFAGLLAQPAFAQKACMNEGKAAAAHYQDDAALTAAVQQVKQVQQAGLDPNRYLVEDNGGYTLLTMKLHALAEQSATSLETSRCTQKMAPFRKLADVKMIYQHYGLSGMLPPAMAQTDYLGVTGGAPMPAGGMMPAETVFGVRTLPMSPEVMKILHQPYCIFGACS